MNVADHTKGQQVYRYKIKQDNFPTARLSGKTLV
jgi:hypothetical protein